MHRHSTSCRLSFALWWVLGGVAVAARGQCPPDWLPGIGIAGVDGSLNAATTWDADGVGPQPGLLIVGGDFSIAGTGYARKIVAWDGTRWSALGAGFASDVLALTTFDDGSGPALYAGGEFEVARWDGNSWSQVGTIPGSPSTVRSLAWFGDGSGPRLFAGGPFYSGPSSYGFAVWDGANWTLGGCCSSAQLAVYDLGDRPALYECDSYVRRWNGTSFSTLPGGTVSGVRRIAFFDDGTGPALYAGGTFTTVGGIPANRIAKWRDGVWSALGEGVSGPSASVSALAVLDDGSGPALYVGGSFTSAGGAPAGNIAKWDGATWSVFGEDNTNIRLLTVFDDGRGPALIAGGLFQDADHVARWTGDSWAPLGSAGFNSSIAVLERLDDGTGPALYAGGWFTRVVDAPANRIARWDGATWSALGDGLSLEPSSSAAVRDIVGHDDGTGFAIYAGGRFASPGTALPGGVARWNGVNWTGVGEGFTNDVYTLVPFDDGAGTVLYAGGSFRRIGDAIIGYVAKWNGVTWLPVGAGLPGNINEVHSMVVFDDGSGPALYVAGYFPTAGAATANSVARWDGTAWSALGSGLLLGANRGRVYGLAVFNDGGGPALYAAGRFTSADGIPTANVARWNGVEWSAVGAGLGNGLDFDVDQIVNSIRVADDRGGPALFAVGSLSLSIKTPWAMAAKWNGANWSPLDTSVSGYAYDIASFNDAAGPTIHLGGNLFARSGEINAHWMRLGPVCPLGDLNCDNAIDFLDIDPFLLTLFDPAAYAANHPACDIGNADTNADGLVNFFDIDGFLECLFGTCP